jgi:hypothetical protein
MNAQGLKLPLRSVLQSVETLLPSKVTLMVSFALKPLPYITMLLPAAPAREIRRMAGSTV